MDGSSISPLVLYTNLAVEKQKRKPGMNSTRTSVSNCVYFLSFLKIPDKLYNDRLEKHEFRRSMGNDANAVRPVHLLIA